jgi:hypothetical protein
VNSTPASGSQARAVQVTRWLPDRRAQDKVRNARERQALRAGERTGLVPRERNAVVADEFGDDADAGHARHGHQVGRGSVCPVRLSTPPGRARNGNTSPGRRRSVARVPGPASTRTVAARSAAEMQGTHAAVIDADGERGAVTLGCSDRS